ncbi:TPA: YbaY family lipoprotein [Providencia stuartii]|uniref:YbaY family lipoprotein n=1 Tax=Providencia stuartii TaxID=588 RepID=UPI00254322BD|nr:YbaY family lipoprotein [Providencia thailandensis]WIJ73123.1 YbaY family lipoprotein [Providencia thailandensis]
MKLHLCIIGFVLPAFLVGCEGNNNVKETKVNNHSHNAKQHLDTDVIRGQVVIPQQVKLPQNAVITVTLADISIAELPALILSQKYYETLGKQSPFPFELSYQKNEVRPDAHLAMRATVSVDGNILLISKVENLSTSDDTSKEIRLVIEPTS